MPQHGLGSSARRTTHVPAQLPGFIQRWPAAGSSAKQTRFRPIPLIIDPGSNHLELARTGTPLSISNTALEAWLASERLRPTAYSMGTAMGFPEGVRRFVRVGLDQPLPIHTRVVVVSPLSKPFLNRLRTTACHLVATA